MNRSLVIFVALAILVAHSMAIRTDAAGALVPPYDQAFIAYRVARNLVFEGTWTWSPGQSGFDSYPSTLWVMICAAAERLPLSINFLMRGVGITASATTLILTTRFHPDRAASLIVPMLLAISGAVAAATVSGTEAALLAALVTGAFLAFERRWEIPFAIVLVLCGWTRGEGWVLIATFFALRVWARRPSAPKDEPVGSLKPFLAPAIGLLALAALRWRVTGGLASPWAQDLFDLRAGELENGVAYLRDGFVSCVSPALVVYAVWYLLRKNLSRTGKRALLLSFVWILLVVIQGGGPTPFAEGLVPVLPLLLLAGQEGLITALNSARPAVRGLAWSSFLIAVLASALASFRPANIGPIPFEDAQRSWMQPTARLRFGFEDELGRLGLDEEKRATRSLREIAIFLRDEVDPGRTVLTPYPGSIAYISGLPVRDLLGRATPVTPYERTSFSPLQVPVDVLAELERAPEYIVPFWRDQSAMSALDALTITWAELDLYADEPGRSEAVRAALGDYQVVTVPLNRRGRENPGLEHDRAWMLRRRSLTIGPRLTARMTDGILTVELEHHGHLQLADLEVSATDSLGQVWYVDPTGRMQSGTRLHARSNVLLTETGERRVRLLQTELERGSESIRELRIELVNPDQSVTDATTRVAEPVLVEFP